MARIIDYDLVQQTLVSRGMRSSYYNGGAFHFPQERVFYRGWIGPPDATIHPAMLESVRLIDPPYERHLADMSASAWQRVLPGVAWIMPMAHWHFELTYGNRAWLAPLITKLGIDPATLEVRTNAAAIEFAVDEISVLREFVFDVMTHLQGSDFAIAFPDHPCYGVLHHHKQVWWMTTEEALAKQLDHAADPL